MITFRQPRLSDITKIMKLEKAIFEDPWSYGLMLTMLIEGSRTSRIAIEKGKAAGYLICLQSYPTLHIANLAVAPDRRGQGLGKRLMDEALTIANQTRSEAIVLEVRPSNHTAIRLYEKYGFIIISRKKQYYDNGEDAYTMLKPMGA